MEPFIVSARKYRPQSFKDVVGQSSITNTLTNAIKSNHLAQALLFCGPRGVGKTTCARILAKQINKDDSIKEDEDFAFNIFELDAASNNSVDDIRNLIDQVRIPPQVGKYKVYIIDEVHMLSQSAFNAFLKTLEEPPKHAIFILATTEKHKIIPTILSRCQIFDFKRITIKDAAEYLKHIAEKQGINAEEDALHIIARKADGAMRDALSIFDRVVSYSGKELTRKAVTENLNVLDNDTYFAATDLILSNNIPALLILFNDVLAQGFEGHHFITGLASHFRDLLVCRHKSTLILLEMGEKAKANYLEQSQKAEETFFLRALELANDCDLKYKTSRNHRLLVELTLMKLASLEETEKKNSNSLSHPGSTILPAARFRSPSKDGGALIKTVGPELQTQAEEQSSRNSNPEIVTSESHPERVSASEERLKDSREVTASELPGKVRLREGVKRVSGLSISSLKAKKEHLEARTDDHPEDSPLPNDAFNEIDLQRHWDDYVKKLEKEGRKILASNLSTDLPRLVETSVIRLELPNHSMKKEIEKEQLELLGYLRNKLNNHNLSMRISVNEENAKRYAFTPEEKYQKLREKNPAIDLLRKEFDLDL